MRRVIRVHPRVLRVPLQVGYKQVSFPQRSAVPQHQANLLALGTEFILGGQNAPVGVVRGRLRVSRASA